MLFCRNKWLLMHPEAAEEGQYVGLVGENHLRLICVERRKTEQPGLPHGTVQYAPFLLKIYP